MNFDVAFETLIGHEAGYVNHPSDPGGETKYGITKRTYPNEDIRNLTIERAKEIYKRDFWNKVKGDQLPYVVAFNFFDGAVNSGVSNSVRWLQRASSTEEAPVADDGKFGPISLGAALRFDPEVLAARYNGERLQFMTNLSTWSIFGRGWARRIANNLKGI